jgi:hypothetical protein
MSNKFSSVSIGAIRAASVLLTAMVAALIATLGAERNAEAAFSWISASVTSQAIDVPNLSDLGANTVTIAPPPTGQSLTSFYLLSATKAAHTYDYLAYYCSWNGTNETCSSQSDYFWSLAWLGDPFAIDTSGNAWRDNAGWGQESWGTGVYWASIAPTSASDGYITDGDDSSCSTVSHTQPYGACIKHWTSNGTPTIWNYGAFQVTIDSRNTSDLYMLSADNLVYSYISGTLTPLGKKICNTTTVPVLDGAGRDEGRAFMSRGWGRDGHQSELRTGWSGDDQLWCGRHRELLYQPCGDRRDLLSNLHELRRRL